MTERKHFLDLTRCHFQRTLGDIQLYGTWVPRGDDDDHTEPALVLMSRRFGGRRAAWRFRAHTCTMTPVIVPAPHTNSRRAWGSSRVWR